MTILHMTLVVLRRRADRHRTALHGAALYASVTLVMALVTQPALFGIGGQPLLFAIGAVGMTAVLVLCTIVMVGQILVLIPDAIRAVGQAVMVRAAI